MIETHYDCPCLEKCPLNYAMSIIGGKWKMQIICALNNKGTLRYNQLRRKMDGISNTALAAALKELEEEGLVTRKVYTEVPIKVEYSTTELCDRLMPILESLSDWGEELMIAGGMETASGKGIKRKSDAAKDSFIINEGVEISTPFRNPVSNSEL